MPRRVLIYEYFTGGGLVESSTLPPVLTEAYAMLSALLKDFSQNAGCETVVILDEKIAEMTQPLAASKIAKVSSKDEPGRVFRSTLAQVDAALVVAPETNNTLFEATKVVEDEAGHILLGSSSDAVKHVCNKKRTIETASAAGVAVPRSITTSTDEREETAHGLARDIGYPVIVKPNDGAGCEGVFVVQDRQNLDIALKILRRERSKRTLLIQEYVKGTDASVSLLSTKNGRTSPISLNRQIVELKTPGDASSAYEGGVTPFDHPLKSETYDCASKIADKVSGLKGYIGMDFVLTEEKPVFMEVNARITTSYVGLSRVLLTNGRKGVASAIIDATTTDELPSRIGFKGYAYYSRLRLKPDLKVDRDMIDVLSNLEYVESPPFPSQEGAKEGFLVNVGRSFDEASILKSRNEKKFDQIALKLEKHQNGR